jgi:hypothetical protein
MRSLSTSILPARNLRRILKPDIAAAVGAVDIVARSVRCLLPAQQYRAAIDRKAVRQFVAPNRF